jgi:CBS domain-containing protein
MIEVVHESHHAAIRADVARASAVAQTRRRGLARAQDLRDPTPPHTPRATGRGTPLAVSRCMKVSALCHRDFVSCADRDTADHAAYLMWEFDIGSLPVVGDDGAVIGMVTDRDICMAGFLQGRPLRSITISSIMARDLVACREDDDVVEVEERMRQRQVRRLPVLAGDRLVGMISLNDLARAASRGELPPADVAFTLASITRPRLPDLEPADR